MSDVPDWAIDKAISLLNSGRSDDCGLWGNGDLTDTATGLPQFAAYIASKEDAPVDPLVLEAREIAAKYFEAMGSESVAQEHREGLYDKDDEAQEIAMAALRRGIELGKAQS